MTSYEELLIMKSEIVITPRYSETDQMGIIYHANYFPWFEMGRTDLLAKIGFAYKSIEDMGILFPLTEGNCKYKIAAKYDEDVRLVTKFGMLKGTKARFDYEIYRVSDDVCLATGFTEHGFVDKNLKPVRLRRDYKDLWDAMESSYKESIE
jgi:acyl-CoA thioester hydrolase